MMMPPCLVTPTLYTVFAPPVMPAPATVARAVRPTLQPFGSVVHMLAMSDAWMASWPSRLTAPRPLSDAAFATAERAEVEDV